jgi:hypothetical protein
MELPGPSWPYLFKKKYHFFGDTKNTLMSDDGASLPLAERYLGMGTLLYSSRQRWPLCSPQWLILDNRKRMGQCSASREIICMYIIKSRELRLVIPSYNTRVVTVPNCVHTRTSLKIVPLIPLYL